MIGKEFSAVQTLEEFDGRQENRNSLSTRENKQRNKQIDEQTNTQTNKTIVLEMVP